MFYQVLPRRLDAQMALVCVIALVCTMPWFILHETNEELKIFLTTVKKQTEVLTSNVAVTSVEHIITNDFSSLDALLMRSAAFPGIIDIQVSDKQGKILSDVFLNDKSEPVTRFTRAPPLEVPAGNSSLTLFENDRMVVWAPVASGVLLGWVKLNYSLDEANKHKHTRIRDYMIDASVITFALAALLIMAMRRPLRMISVAADFSNRLDEKSGEQIPMQRQSVELDKLYLALNRVSSSLADQDAAIKRAVKDLETQKHALDEHSIVSIYDVRGNITYANDKLLSSTGYKLEELLGKNFSVVNSGYHEKEFFLEIWGTISQGCIWCGDIVSFNKHGHKIWMQTTIVPFLNSKGKPYEYVSIQTDITAQKYAEALLAEKNAALKDLTGHLEQKVEMRTAELQHANEELVHLNNIKSEFVSIVSHELRTPLTSIRSYAEILADDFDEIDAETRRHYLSIIDDESVRLGKLINDVLDLQKIDAGKMTWNKEKTELRCLVSRAIELFSRLYQDKGLELHLEMGDDELYANIDADKVIQVLNNLLSNAYKFTSDGCVSVEVRRSIQNPTALIVDDDESSRGYLETLLRDIGIVVISCDDLNNAFAMIKDKDINIDLVISNIIMQGMAGAQVVNAFRDCDEKLPIIAVSPGDGHQDASLLPGDSVIALLDKPFRSDAVIRAVEKIFGNIANIAEHTPMAEVTVSDTGSGISENEIDKVFERFHQIDNSETRDKGGSGLGLSICKEIIAHHGGQLWLTSTLGKGSRFTFTLPLFEFNKKRIGEILVDAGVVTQEIIDNALANQK